MRTNFCAAASHMHYCCRGIMRTSSASIRLLPRQVVALLFRCQSHLSSDCVMALVSAAVIGANGFIGRNVLERLRAEGIPTTLIGRQTLCEEWPSSVDVVFFCAGNSSTVLTRRDPA